MLDKADCADFGCHNSIRLETKHFLNTLALTFISFSGRFVFAMQKHYLFFCERSSSLFLLSEIYNVLRGIGKPYAMSLDSRSDLPHTHPPPLWVELQS